MNAPEAPPFDEPWQTQVFAIAVALNQRGQFIWSEWARALGAKIAAGGRQGLFFRAGCARSKKSLPKKAW